MDGPILITGAAGFAGSHLLDLLAADRREVVAWHRPGGAPPRQTPSVTWQGVDLMDRRQVADRVAGLRPGFVYHCAGAPHVDRAWQSTEPTFAINVRGTHHLIEGLREAGVKARVLIPSSALVYAASSEPISEAGALVPSSPYGLSKLAQEMLGADADGPLVSVARAFNHIGPRQDPTFAASTFARQIADIEAGRLDPVMSVGNLEARRDITDVRDTVRAYRLILEKGAPGRTYNVCSGRTMAIRELLDMLLRRAKKPIRIAIDPERFRPNDVPIVVGDPTRISTELGWQPTISLEQTADDLLEFWRKQIATSA